MESEGLEKPSGARREEEEGAGTMTDGHRRREDDDGGRSGVGGPWRCFKAPTGSGGEILHL